MPDKLQEKLYELTTQHFQPEKDEIIPKAITYNYKNIKSAALDFEIFTLKDAPHNIWKDEEKDRGFRDEIYIKIIESLN